MWQRSLKSHKTKRLSPEAPDTEIYISHFTTSIYDPSTIPGIFEIYIRTFYKMDLINLNLFISVNRKPFVSLMNVAKHSRVILMSYSPLQHLNTNARTNYHGDVNISVTRMSNKIKAACVRGDYKTFGDRQPVSWQLCRAFLSLQCDLEAYSGSLYGKLLFLLSNVLFYQMFIKNVKQCKKECKL